MSSNLPIKINTSMTTMSMAPDHYIKPLSPVTPKSGSDKSVSIPSPVSVTVSPRTPYYPNSPVSPHDLSDCKPDSDSGIKYQMIKKGYIPSKLITSTLQGSIWRTKKANEPFVVKVTQKSLHEQHVAIVDGTAIEIQEDIIKETAILRYLSSFNPPKNLVNFESFFSDKDNYYLVMEDGGTGLFDFVSKCHQFITSGKISIKEWQRFCKMAFRQMISLIDWLHNKMNCCHLDVSLENFVISNVMVSIKNKKIIFSNDFTIKMIDFGLAEVFTSKNKDGKISFNCTKYCGKTAYKSPGVYGRRKVFDARGADVWSLGVCLFMMIVGGSPYARPTKSDISFGYIIRGSSKILELLKKWNREKLVTPCIVDLISRIFKKEKYRLDINAIKSHPWLL